MGFNAGMNNDTLKRRNRGLVLKLIATGECTTRTALAKRTNLSKMSVSNVINEFMSQEIVEERSKLSVQGQGRNPIGLSLSAKAPKMIGLNIFRDECVAVLCDLQLNILKEYHIAMNQERADHLSDVLYHTIDQVMPQSSEPLLGIGIGSIGPVDLERGMLLTPPNFFGVHDYAFIKSLKKRYDFPIYMDSQYNCAALAEKYFGIGRQYQDFIFAGISSGIGSGIISDGGVLRNASGLTSELGHISIDWHGNLCTCGNRGCLETYAGTRIMERRLRMATEKNRDFQEFCRLAETSETPEIHALFEEMTDALGCALTTEVNLFNPQAVIIGHEGYALPEKYLKRLEDVINRDKLVQNKCRVRVLKSAFGTQAQIKSSACSLLSHVFDGEFV